MRIDVAICTWNRSALLSRTLQRLVEMRVPPDIEWRVLIVNNNSTDATPGVLRTFSTRLPLRDIFEPQPGLANARNRAVRETTADYLVWTDDDVLVDPDWLAAYSRAFATWPDAAFFGGPIEPWFEGTPPRWLEEHWQKVETVFAVRQLGESPLPFDNAHVPFGANCATRVDVQRRFLYDPSLGRRPHSNVGGEETQVIRQMLAAGHTGWWVPDAKVQHFIPRHRQSVRYVRQVVSGVGEVWERGRRYGSPPRPMNRPRLLLKKALAAEARYRWIRLTAPPDVWLARLTEAAKAWGHLKAASGPR
jgi:glucosyl-dolichyl phosphate glucuronosyltransferase